MKKVIAKTTKKPDTQNKQRKLSDLQFNYLQFTIFSIYYQILNNSSVNIHRLNLATKKVITPNHTHQRASNVFPSLPI